MLVDTVRVSAAWQPIEPQVSGATRRSPGFTNLMYLSGFRKPLRESTFGKIRTVTDTRIARLDVGFFFCGIIFGGISRGDGCDGDVEVATVAISTHHMHLLRRMPSLLI